MVRASLDRQIDTTVIVASCFPLVEQVRVRVRVRVRVHVRVRVVEQF